MQEYMIELSKYIIPICMAFYTFECFSVFRFKDEHARKGIYLRQSLLIFLIQFLCYMTLTLKSGTADYLFFYAFVQIFLFSILTLVRMIYEKVNRLLLNNMCMLLGIGLVIISRLSFHKAIKQFIIVLFSLILALIIPYAISRLNKLHTLTWVYAFIGIASLSAVLILGEVTHGSRLSFSIAGVSFQPSEFVKIIFVFFLAAALCEDTSLQRVALTALVAGAHVIILVLSTDLGGALIFFVAYVFIVFIATGQYRYLLAGLAAGCVAAVTAYQLFGHVQIRVLAWQNPWAYIDNKGYQITQSLFAIGSGSWFGMGLQGGTPGVIPYVEVDFIFSAICEELGVIFGMCLLLVCISCFIMMMNISVRLKDTFYRLIALGLGIMYIFQVFLTVGGGIKFIPLTGVTLPLVSYGGSSVLTTMILFFIIQGLYVRRQQEGVRRHVVKRAERSTGPENN